MVWYNGQTASNGIPLPDLLVPGGLGGFAPNPLALATTNPANPPTYLLHAPHVSGCGLASQSWEGVDPTGELRLPGWLAVTTGVRAGPIRQHGVAGADQAAQHVEELADIFEGEACGGLVEDVVHGARDLLTGEDGFEDQLGIVAGDHQAVTQRENTVTESPVSAPGDTAPTRAPKRRLEVAGAKDHTHT